jgi:hypothetical protein
MTSRVETAILALQSALENDATISGLIQSFARRMEHWSVVGSQPALFIRHISNEYKYEHDTLQRMTVNCEIWLYERSGADPDAISDTQLNNIEEAINSLLSTDDEGGRYTLGGAVYWCRLEGKAEFKPGDMDQQGLMLLPVSMMLLPQ